MYAKYVVSKHRCIVYRQFNIAKKRVGIKGGPDKGEDGERRTSVNRKGGMPPSLAVRSGNKEFLSTQILQPLLFVLVSY